MHLLVFGRTGQVGRELCRRAPSDVSVTALDRSEADLGQPDRCAAAIAKTDADVIINAAAYTAVDKAEGEPDRAFAINAAAPAAMAAAAADRALPFFHLSTDYVFDGTGHRPWSPDADPAPINVYGRTKRAGEQAVASGGGRHIILRTSWVFSAHGKNFVKTMLRLAADHDRLAIVGDQIGGPTAAADIADALFGLARHCVNHAAPGGVYHFAGTPYVSWADFAREIFRQSGTTLDIDTIPTSAYPTPARRPLNSRLECSSLVHHFGIGQPDWRQSLTTVLAELRNSES